MDAHLKKPVFTGFFHAFQSKIFSVKPWMLFHDFHRPEGFEPSTNEYCQIKRQALSRFRSRLAFFMKKHSQSLEGCFVKYHEM
jgi:hypothetical protein